ncbi:integral membrane protein pth11 [Fusarium globosum]|uniref:Integral membrane protein pth11 n=1 Tax=Fusarium globosum TaxID=78864 RepID=A0A8H5XL53_9HYPO|nr:integral membrane protein pth11 [Fusarium globosum]
MATNKDIEIHEENGSALVATAITLLTLSWFSVGLRTYTRAVLMKSLQLDDWLMLVAQIIFTISCAFILEGVQKGIGKHNDAIKDDEAKVQALMWQALATATYILDMMFIKLSIGVFLLRLCVKRVYVWIIRISLAIISIWSVVLFFWNLFQCKPVEMQWDFRIKDGTCVSADQIVSAAYAISVMTVVSDWLYALLPIPMLCASVATLVRLRFLADLTDTEDILFAGTDAMVWTLIEPGVAIVASSLATIRPLLRAMRIRGFESTENTYGTGHSAAVRSNANRSKTGILIMPGFGPEDVSLTNMVSQNNTNSLSHPNDIEILPPRHVGDGPTSPGQASIVKSEILVIQGNSSPPSSWQNRNDRSASSSFDQIHDLEAYSQELERDDMRGRGR